MSIDELKAEVAAAVEGLKNAEATLRAARDRLQAAMNEASGLIGHVLEFDRGYGSRARKVRILVDRVAEAWRGPTAFGRYILKNGSAGVHRSETLIANATDLGLHVSAPTKDAEGRIVAEVMED